MRSNNDSNSRFAEPIHSHIVVKIIFCVLASQTSGWELYRNLLLNSKVQIPGRQPMLCH